MVSTDTARLIASDWHGGMMSAMYGFASTGRIRDRHALIREIADSKKYAGPREKRRLEMLHDFVASN